jgi:hypothetical protein
MINTKNEANGVNWIYVETKIMYIWRYIITHGTWHWLLMKHEWANPSAKHRNMQGYRSPVRASLD